MKTTRRLGFQIPIGPVIVVTGDRAPGGVFDLCVERQVGDFTCGWCLIGRRDRATLGR